MVQEQELINYAVLINYWFDHWLEKRSTRPCMSCTCAWRQRT
uniref:Uncharacterized protein n=1 Tax=Arundo donax TaxID=35708 RepID=A0A0A9G736_ARUDO